MSNDSFVGTYIRVQRWMDCCLCQGFSMLQSNKVLQDGIWPALNGHNCLSWLICGILWRCCFKGLGWIWTKMFRSENLHILLWLQHLDANAKLAMRELQATISKTTDYTSRGSLYCCWTSTTPIWRLYSLAPSEETRPWTMFTSTCWEIHSHSPLHVG